MSQKLNLYCRVILPSTFVKNTDKYDITPHIHAKCPYNRYVFKLHGSAGTNVKLKNNHNKYNHKAI